MVLNSHAATRNVDMHMPSNDRSNIDGIQTANGTSQPSNSLEQEDYDLIVAGFGPAALSIAIAIEDALEETNGQALHGLSRKPRILFLEKQEHFAWHPGMLLEGTRMQISFIKDLATLRNPRSRFTFLNYLHTKKRIIQFSNLDTFLPARLEFQDYLKWCAQYFEDDVRYGQEVLKVFPDSYGSDGAIERFRIAARSTKMAEETTFRARHVVIAIGGQPSIPKLFQINNNARIIHSSRYAQEVSRQLQDTNGSYKIAVVGGGQSAAEVFDNLHSRYPKSKTHLLLRGSTLRPSDDSPFVNEIFDPERIRPFYEADPEIRHATNGSHQNTNYGVVRLQLLEKVYETLYMQRLAYDREEEWPHRIMPNASIVQVRQGEADRVRLEFNWKSPGELSKCVLEAVEYDLVVLATGYGHNGHEDILKNLESLEARSGQPWTVGKDYRLVLNNQSISRDAGIWLQGCNEATHGLSDTLLSGLAVRGGELVHSIFDNPLPAE
ncbi:hypothetical protein BT63DRAFT_483939 [Microthyrium microscopicum]|uniref:L-ornithine N(5)-monooxygenase [NAD(P)H] n=1 Tax=Microthyrium microscopicum TaxID=703497 RepID=A0A6A6TXQ5_9PEZI|nr:hypothetical protein BT63DRAFT_483939 [Microthyrium microscopicum]